MNSQKVQRRIVPTTLLIYLNPYLGNRRLIALRTFLLVIAQEFHFFFANCSNRSKFLFLANLLMKIQFLSILPTFLLGKLVKEIFCLHCSQILTDFGNHKGYPVSDVCHVPKFCLILGTIKDTSFQMFAMFPNSA